MQNHIYLLSYELIIRGLIIYYSHHMNNSDFNHVLDEISRALLASSCAQNQQQIKRSQETIQYYQTQRGYIRYLLHIINSNLPSVSSKHIQMLVSSSFAQLKVTTRSYWLESQHESSIRIPRQDKQYFLNMVIQTAFNISSVNIHSLKYRYMKLFKDVLQLTCVQSIIIAPQLLESINIGLRSKDMYFVLPVYLNLLLAFNNNLSLYLDDKYYNKNLQVTREFHRIMYEFVQNGSAQIHALYQEINDNINNQQYLQVKLHQYNLFKRNYQEILYICIKYIYKSARNRADNIRNIVLDWIPFAIQRIEFIDQAFTKESNQKQCFSKSMGNKGNDQFNYFHSKKWGLKLLQISLDKILVYKIDDNNAFRQVNLFYYKNCNQIIILFKNIWNYLWPQKIVVQLLVCFQIFIRKKPQKLAQQQQELLLKYQKQILIPFMSIDSQQLQILQQSPLQFIARQERIKYSNGYFSYRVAAFNVWLSIATIQKYYCEQSSNRGQYLQLSLNLLGQWLQYWNIWLRDTVCLLLIKLADQYAASHIKQKFYLLVNHAIQQNMQNLKKQHYMLTIRTLELIKIAGRELNPSLNYVTKSIMVSIFNGYEQSQPLSNPQIFVLIRNSQAYFRIMATAKQQDIQQLKYVCMRILKLVKKTSVQNFIKEANNLLKNILSKQRNFARNILLQIKGWVRYFMQKDLHSFKHDKAIEYKQNFSQCAKGVQLILLKLMNYVRQGQQQITLLLQEQIIAILYYFFSQGDNDPQNRDDGLQLLQKFLFDNFNRTTISPQIIKLCRFIVIKLAGIPNRLITKLKSNPNSINCEQDNHVLYYQCQEQYLYGFRNYHSIIKSFIRFFNYGQSIRPIRDINNTLLESTTNNAQLIIYFVYKFFRQNNNNTQALRQGKCFSLLMLIYYYQHHQRKDCTQRVHQSINQFTFNIIQLSFGLYQTNPIFVKYTAQLFALWMNQVKQGSFAYLSTMSNEDLKRFFKNIFLFNGGEEIRILRQTQQKSRLVSGICQILRLTLNNPALSQYITYQILSELLQIIITMMAEQMQELTISSGQRQTIENNQADERYEQQYKQQQGQIQDDLESEEYEAQASSDSDDSFNFQQDLSMMQSSPYDAQTECIILLTTLYQLYTHNQSIYWKIIQEIQCNSDIATILRGSGCFEEQSKYYLKALCKMQEWNDEID